MLKKPATWVVTALVLLIAACGTNDPNFTYSPAGAKMGLSEEGKKFFTSAAQDKLKGFDMTEVTFVDALVEADDTRVLVEFTIADSNCKVTVFTYDGKIGLDVPFEEGKGLDRLGGTSRGILWFDGTGDPKLRARPEVKHCNFNQPAATPTT